MTLNTLPADLTDDGLPAGGAITDLQALAAAVSELQRLKITAVAGAAAVTNIAVAGIATTDTLMGVIRLNRDASAANIDISDLLSEASITSAGNIQLATTNTSGDALLVIWHDKVA